MEAIVNIFLASVFVIWGVVIGIGIKNILKGKAKTNGM